MALAEIGPLTTVLEMAATAVGAGVVLGSVVAGIIRLATGFSMREIESRALVSGYAGGAVGAAAVIADAILRYGG